MRICIHIIICLSLLLSACTRRSNHYDSVDIKPSWALSKSNSQINKRHKDVAYKQSYWWKNFNDYTLNNLVNLAIKNNLDFKIALARIKEGRANLVAARSALFPAIDLSEQFSRSNRISSLSGTNAGSSKNINLFTPALDASWEVDLFGTNADLKEAAFHNLYAMIADKNYFLTTLIADMVINYIEYRKYQTLLLIANEEIKSQKEIMDMVKAKFNAGVSSELELKQVSAVYLATKNQRYMLNYQLVRMEYSIETLCGLQTGSLKSSLKTPRPIPSISTKIIANSPLYIVQKRPDIVKSEQELLAATSLTESAISSQFPKISLSALVGYQSSNVLPNQKIWSVGQSLIGPLIDFGRIKSIINMREAQEEQAFLNYQSVILKALAEIEFNFVKYLNNKRSYDELRELVLTNQQAFNLSKDLYSSSTISYIDLLATKKELLTAKANALQAQAELSETAVVLYKVLGH